MLPSLASLTVIRPHAQLCSALSCRRSRLRSLPLQFSLGGGYAGFAFLSTAFQRKRSQGHLLSVASLHARYEGEFALQSMYLQLLERGCVANAAIANEDGHVVLSKVSDSLIRPHVDVEEIHRTRARVSVRIRGTRHNSLC